MQAQLSVVSENLQKRRETSISSWQMSADSDDICLALIAPEQGKLGGFKRVIVKLPT